MLFSNSSLAIVLLYGWVIVEDLTSNINCLHERWVRINDDLFTFQEQLQKDNSVMIHHQNIQKSAIELYKIKNGLSPSLIAETFPLWNIKKQPEE